MPKKIIHLPRDFKPPPRPELEPDSPQCAAARKLGLGLALLMIPLGGFIMWRTGKIQHLYLGMYLFCIVLFLTMQIRPGTRHFWEVLFVVLYLVFLPAQVRGPKSAAIVLTLWFLILVRFGYRLCTVYRDEPRIGRILAALGMGLATLAFVSSFGGTI